MSGHGHVTANADGSRARCGGPGICIDCSREAAGAWRQERERAERAEAERDALRVLLTKASKCADVAGWLFFTEEVDAALARKDGK